MPKFVHSDVLDNGLNAIKNGATTQLLIKAYAAGDSYATVVDNALASVAMTPADYTLSTSGSDRVLTTAAGKSAAAAAGAAGTPDLHFAFTNGVDKVLWVTDETSNQPITAGNTINFPQLTHTNKQPV